ncbi:MAG: alpha/beta hydrolase [Ottowia sp.]|uniref:alpha/beta fold hydrolase n=1 Tax=Ottowia sp. TaxID=1898956 RepID=UPI003C7786AD
MTTTFVHGLNLAANGIRQHVLRYGGAGGERAQRDAVVLVPGITSPAITWGFVGERLGRHFDTYVLDVRGRGLSSASDQLDYSLDAQIADAVALVKALGLERYALVGHSMGGRIVAGAAAAAPQGLTRVVMIDPPVSGPGRRPYPANYAWYADSIAAATVGCNRETMRGFCPTWTDEQLDLRAEWLHTCDLRAIKTSFDGFHTDDFHRFLPGIRVPALLMTAERGDVVKPEDVAEIEGMVPGVLHHRVPGAGHMIPWDNEEGFYAAFGDFLGVRV